MENGTRRIKSAKLWRLIYITCSIVALTVISIVFYGDKEIAFAVVGPVAIIYFPALFGFGWLYVRREIDDPVRFLGLWCSATQLINLAANLIRIMPSAWGITGVVLTILTIALIIVYSMGLFRGRKGNLITVVLIIFTTSMTFWFILSNLNKLNPMITIPMSEGYPWMIARSSEMSPWMADEYRWLTLLGGILTYGGIFSVLTSLAPQVFLLDFERKIREYWIMETLFESRTLRKNSKR